MELENKTVHPVALVLGLCKDTKRRDYTVPPSSVVQYWFGIKDIRYINIWSQGLMLGSFVSSCDRGELQQAAAQTRASLRGSRITIQ